MFYLSLDSTFMGVKNKIEFFFLLKTSTQNKKVLGIKREHENIKKSESEIVYTLVQS